MVQRALYLLFNEGYHGASAETSVRATLCREALYLARLLLGHPSCDQPSTRALAALMTLHAARLPARLDGQGELVPLREQDRRRWDAALTAEGKALLDASATGDAMSEYHVEAAIAAVHAEATSAEATRWPEIVALYDTLMVLRPSPVVALGRAIAIGQAEGPDAGLHALRALADDERVTRAPFHDAAVADLAWQADRRSLARTHLRAALAKARNPLERRFFAERLRRLGDGDG